MGSHRDHYRRLAYGAELDPLDWDARRELARDLIEAEGAEVVWDEQRHAYRLDLLGYAARAKSSPWAAVDGWIWDLILRARVHAAARAQRAAE